MWLLLRVGRKVCGVLLCYNLQNLPRWEYVCLAASWLEHWHDALFDTWTWLQVYKGVWQGNTPVAVKFVTGHSPKEQQRFRNEVAILKSLRHVNIVQFLGASLTGDQIMLVTEYMPRGDLWRALSQDSTHHFSWNNV